MKQDETVGKKKLKHRIKKNENVIFPTEKSGKLTVSTPEIYKEAAKVHLNKDKGIPWKNLKPTETLVKRHVLQLVKALIMGSAHNQGDRIEKTMRTPHHPAHTSFRKTIRCMKYSHQPDQFMVLKLAPWQEPQNWQAPS